MNRDVQWFHYTVVSLLLATGAAWAQDSLQSGTVETSLKTGLQPGQSPVEVFRKILGMTPSEREQFLTNYPVAVRSRIAEKAKEYQSLEEPLRELRLRTTELRWYLLPLLKMSPTNRVERLQQIPEPYQKLVAVRLDEWDLWPPSLKEEILEYEDIMDHFVAGGTQVPPPVPRGATSPVKWRSAASEKKLARFQALPAAQREQMYASFQHYFNLSEDERQKTLEALSEPERQETEKILDPIEKWPKPQQEKYMAAFQRFANMSAAEREQFLKNAERWRKMSETERQAWRDLIEQLSNMPPLPPGFVPDREPAGPGLPGVVRTNPTSAPQE